MTSFCKLGNVYLRKAILEYYENQRDFVSLSTGKFRYDLNESFWKMIRPVVSATFVPHAQSFKDY